jgi:hypothetical protein
MRPVPWLPQKVKPLSAFKFRFLKEISMKSVLVPIDDSNDTEWAIKHVIELYREQPVRVFLLNVQAPLSKHISRFINSEDINDFHRENGMRALQPLMQKLDESGVAHTERVVVGHKAESIARFARENHCAQIVLPKRKGMFGNLGSVGSQLRHLIGPEMTCDISEVY